MPGMQPRRPVPRRGGRDALGARAGALAADHRRNEAVVVELGHRRGNDAPPVA